MGSDTWNYMAKFMRMRYVDFGDSAFLRDDNEIGYKIFEKLLVTVFPFEQAILIAQALIVTISYGVFIYKFCRKNYFLSILIFMSFGLISFHLTGIRQSIAMSVCAWAYIFFDEKKYLRAILSIALAVTFHTSAIVALLYFLFGVVWKRHNGIISAIVLCVVCYISVPRVLTLFSEYVERWDGYNSVESTGNGWIYFAVLLAVIIVAELTKKFLNESERFHVRVNYLTLIFWAGRLVTRTFERPCMYFYPATMPTLVNAFDGYEEKSRRQIYICVVVLITAYYIYRFYGRPYESVLFGL